MLKTILSISGKPGLYKLISQGKNMLIVESVNAELREYLAEVLPNFDRERVYVADIKKLVAWYNILISNGITEFKPEGEVKEEAAAE